MELYLLEEGLKFTLYSLEVGESVVDFLTGLKRDNLSEFDRISKRLEQLADRGPTRRITEFNNLGNGLYEAKSSGGGRVIFFYTKGNVVICAYGFPKKTGKTPKVVLRAALARKQSFEAQKASGAGFTISLPEGVDKPKRMP